MLLEELNRVFLDYDVNANWFLRSKGAWDKWVWQTNIELVRIEAKRLQNMLPQLGKALIMRSNDKGSYHLRFPDARLSKEQELQVMIHSLSHRGHVYFSAVVGDSCLRVSKKSKGKVYEPYLVCVVEVNGK